MTEPVVPSPLSSDARLRSYYLGICPDTGQKLWSDDDRVALARAEVTNWHEAHFESTVDIPKAKADASLRQALERSFDKDSQQNPEEFQQRHGYVRKSFDEFISEPVAPQQQGLQALALELDEVLKNPAYMDASHHAHTWYVERATALYRAIYDSASDGGRRG